MQQNGRLGKALKEGKKTEIDKEVVMKQKINLLNFIIPLIIVIVGIIMIQFPGHINWTYQVGGILIGPPILLSLFRKYTKNPLILYIIGFILMYGYYYLLFHLLNKAKGKFIYIFIIIFLAIVLNIYFFIIFNILLFVY